MTRLPDLPGVLSPAQIAATADAIAIEQKPSGMIPWFDGGHADPWNHVEAAMALDVAGRRREAERAYEWLASTQHDDGGWYQYYAWDETVENARRDTNVAAYVAHGVLHHWLITRDRGFLEGMWPVVERAIDFVLTLQLPDGEVLWSYEPDGRRGEFALLTGCASLHLSLRCAVGVAEALGEERPDWELAADRLAVRVAHHPAAFLPKDRWAMDWYYPVLGGAVRGAAAEERIGERWSEFVMEGLGCRCVSDRPWITAAETAELVLTLDAIGRTAEARKLMTWVQYLRSADGAYFTGCVHPQEVHYPGEERSTYTAAAMLIAADALGGFTPAAGLFRGEGVPALQALGNAAEDPETALGRRFREGS